jgi:alkaline phosphatase
MKRLTLCLVLIALVASGADRPARNVILFIGDAGGIPTLNGASIYGHGEPQKLFIQRMPNLGLMDTSAATGYVTDSAAGMTAIVTGQKVNNGVISQADPPQPGQTPGQPLKTILEYAEEKGLSTGVVSNSSMDDATPAACYAHAASRKLKAEIFGQVLTPRFGDGVDIVFGFGRKAILEATRAAGLDLEPALQKKGFAVADSLEAVPAAARRAVVLFESSDFELQPVVDRATAILSKNPKGFFLMVECDLHTTNPERGLKRTLMLDGVVRQTVERMQKDTLVIFTADHSYDFRIRNGVRGKPLILPKAASKGGPLPAEEPRPNARVDDGHTGEEVLVVAAGPGSSRVRGFFANTHLFQIMMSAWGWKQ